jgi:hypothetical protein
VEHHLFPRISHVHYPELNKRLKQVCAEFNVQYREFPTLRSALFAFDASAPSGHGLIVRSSTTQKGDPPDRPSTFSSTLVHSSTTGMSLGCFTV